MRKHFKVISFCLLVLIITTVYLLKLSIFKANAEDITLLTKEQYETYLTSNVGSSNYYTDYNSMIQTYFSSFDIPSEEFESKVFGNSKYKILEITPRSYLGSDSTIISDIDSNVESIKDIYQGVNVNDKYFISNLSNFGVDTMTLKQFVGNREDLDGKYDAIVFASGDYSSDQILSCEFDLDETLTQYEKIYDNNKLTYEGSTLNGVPFGVGTEYDSQGNIIYKGTFKDGKYYGNGSLYSNGTLSYQGGFINGYKNCYGISYENGEELYKGQWLNNQYHGYGILLDAKGWVVYMGFWDQGTQVTKPANDEFLNDITVIKANQIIEDYVNKGLPLFISNDVLIDSSSNLYQYFKDLPSQHPNVFSLDYPLEQTKENLDFYQTLSIMGITELLSQKPHVEIVSQPVQYEDQPDFSYNTDDSLEFSLNLTNQDQADLIFYLDINQDELFDDDELYQYTINRGENIFSLTVPEVYNGLLNYKLEISSNNLSSTYMGCIRVNNEITNIKVLNIVSSMVYDRNSLYDPLLFTQYFENNGDYDITVDSCTIKDFKKNSSDKPCSHNWIMDDYDVILLGQDIFDSNLSTQVYNSIQHQIDNGKPFIFTSSVTKGNPKWVSYFSNELSLSNYKTDLYKTSNSIDKLQIVNDSNYVMYPFNLKNEDLSIPKDINYALNEQYQLDLDNTNLVPLMNMYSSTNTQFDRFDAYNNYYYMKNNNIAYINIGNNSLSRYKDIEHKLLVDAIVNLHIQNKSKDKKITDTFFINNTNNYEDALIDIKDSINFDFSIFGLDTDTYTYKIKVNDIVVQTGDTLNRENVPISLSNLTVVNNNDISSVRICIIVTNSENETHVDGFYVYVANYNNYMDYRRTLNTYQDTNYIAVDNNYFIQYNLDINSINLSDDVDTANLPDTFTLDNIKFNEIIPEGIIVDDLQNEFVISTNDLNQTIVSKDISSITYTLVGNSYEPNINNIPFTIPIKTNTLGSYSLENAQITYNGIGNDVESYQFTNIDFTAIKPLDASMLTPIFNDYLFIRADNPDLYFIDDLRKQFSVEQGIIIKSIYFNNLTSDDSTIFDYDELDYSLTPTGIGEEEFEIVLTDIFGNTVRKSFLVKTYIPITSISLENLTIYLNSPVSELPLTINPDTIDPRNYTVELIPNDGLVAEYEAGMVTAYSVGYVEVVVTGYKENGEMITVNGSIIVNEYSTIHFIEDFIKLYVGENFINTDNIQFIDIDEQPIEWSSSDKSVAIVDPNTGEIIALSSGTAIITARLVSDPTAETRMLVEVYENISDENTYFNPSLRNNSIKLYQDTPYNLESFIIVPNNLDYIQYDFVITDSTGANITVSDFETFGVEQGEITVSVTVTQKDDSGAIIETVYDSITLIIYEHIDPNVDSGENQS